MKKKKESQTDDEIKRQIGQNIKGVRRKQRSFPTAQIVADKLGISRVTLTQIETGRNQVTGVMLWKLACLFDCEIKDFFPQVPEGFKLSKKDIQDISKKMPPEAVRWAIDLFGTPKK